MDTQKLLSYLRQCIKQYQMIEKNDYIAVGLSGGKDSMTLLHGLAHLNKFYPVPFKLCAIYVDLGITKDLSSQNILKNYCQSLDIPFYVVNTQIYDITFEERKEKNPCSLCAKMRKGALNEKALSLGCNKIAYAHHKDDFIETSLMSLFFEGHYYCFPPVTHLDKTGLDVIRPMFYINEREISGFAKRNKIPVVSNPCPADGKTKRQEIKEFIEKSSENFPDIRKNLNAALIDYFQ
ncbi:MAG: tRNA lysidine(34) synthetase TilS [Eubacteriales bacterium]|nr:tRNA lysidine(34) synthetase TilS [Eubacteriales bacterium]